MATNVRASLTITKLLVGVKNNLIRQAYSRHNSLARHFIDFNYLLSRTGI